MRPRRLLLICLPALLMAAGAAAIPANLHTGAHHYAEIMLVRRGLINCAALYAIVVGLARFATWLHDRAERQPRGFEVLPPPPPPPPPPPRNRSE